MSKEIIFEIVLDGKSVHHCNSITIHQSFNAHHTFELVLDQDTLGKLASHDLYDYQDYVGRDLYIGFGERNTDDNSFQGIVTEVSLQQQEGAWGKLVLKGKSTTCLLDAGATYISYEQMTLSDIVNYCIDYTTTAKLNLKNNPYYSDTIAYMCQYGESGFDFLNRLSAEYGEWFFYDGKDLCFGRPSKQKNIELVYGSNLSSMNYAMQVLPVHAEKYSYKSVDDEVLISSLPSDIEGASSLTKTALNRSAELYAKPVKQPAVIRINDKSELDAYVKLQKRKIAASTMLLTASGDSPKVALGNFVTIKLSKKAGVGYEDHGEYLVTKVSHFLTGTGSYTNTFEAIPSSNEVIPFSVSKPVAQTQMALVTDNNDPQSFGRVRVQMLWQQNTDQKTDWIRVMTPDAGGTGEVSKNRGQVFIPEVGDQVLIAFRYNDPNRPFVLGSLFHGTTAAGGQADNTIKSIQTRSGHILEFNDTSNGESITIKDKNGNMIFVDTAGKNITITAPETMTFNAKNLVMNIDDNMTIEIGKDMKTTIGANHTLNITENHEINSNETTENVKQDKQATIGGDFDLSTSSITMDASGGDVLIKSSALATLHGKSDALVNKG
ncbi:type VI secretion system Vgr family protein [Cytophaga aurantiaca]|uniref:type VI secretion system Vgr family protein n=1 Tax=Cytophaga aurantiaca TaxID=29530 RepID=UPI00037B7DEA|nr:phage baseplate assembly protein V [Cytophaga aurantiaca]